ncbi:MAG: DUF1802 family protein [Cyanobacteria bacterium P01_D01_bin.1]
MTILNVSLCLPELDVFALQQGHSIVAVTKRFIVPGKSFALLPCRDARDASQSKAQYQPAFLAQTEIDSSPLSVTHWGSCVLCQQITEESAIDAIAPHTIWTKAALSQHWQNSASTKQKSLFLTFLKIGVLQKPLDVAITPACEQLHKFVPLSNYAEVTNQESVLSPEEFTAKKEQLLSVRESPTLDGDLQEKSPRKLEKAVLTPPTAEEILAAPDWVEKIAEYGNSSDGHTFEKLVRKGLIELGFSNSSEQLAASLDPKATGGAGGLDFYANRPYKIVGECKASQKQKINSDAATQLVRLGLQNLQHDEYPDCIKIVVAAGRLTKGANEIAEGHRINIIRPETMQKLVKSKLTLESDFDLFQLKGSLGTEPFGEAANQKIDQYVDWCLSEWEEKKEYGQLVEQINITLKELSEQPIASISQDFSVPEVRAHHNARFQPIVTTAEIGQILENQQIQNLLVKKRTHVNGAIGYYLKAT